MKTRMSVILSLAAALLPGIAFADIKVLQTKEAELNIGGMTQVLGFGQQVNDPFTDHNRLYLFMKEARFRTNGKYQDYSFNLEFALGGEESVAAQTGVSLSLLDLSVNIPIGFRGSYLKVGQFKVPYGRERLTYSGSSQFLERSVQDLGFRVGRDVGVAFTIHPYGRFSIIGGVFTGGGRDVPPNHYLPERLGIPMLVARAGWGDVDDDLYVLHNDLEVSAPRFAFFINALYTKDSSVGHSSVLNVKLADKSILLNSGWNPYIGKVSTLGQWWQAGADAAMRVPAGAVNVSAEVEINWAGYSNDIGVAHVAGGRAQVGVSYKPFELAVRYSALFFDPHMGLNGAIGKDPVQEITPSATWYLSGQRLKLVGDLPILIRTPIFTEKGVGSYVGTELPDQASILSKAANSTARQSIVEARLMMQASF